MYKNYIDRLQNPNGRQPQPVRIGVILKEKLKAAKAKFRNEKQCKQQELTTKEFF